MKRMKFVVGMMTVAVIAILGGCGSKKIQTVVTSGGTQYQYDAVVEDAIEVVYTDGSKKKLSELDEYVLNRSDYGSDLAVYVKGQGTFNIDMNHYVEANYVKWYYNNVEGLLPSNIQMGTVDDLNAFFYEFGYPDGYFTSDFPASVVLSADGSDVVADVTLKNGATQKVLWGYNQYAVTDVKPVDQGTLGNVDLPKENTNQNVTDGEDGDGTVDQPTPAPTNSTSEYDVLMKDVDLFTKDFSDDEAREFYKVAKEIGFLFDTTVSVDEKLPLLAKYWNYQYMVSTDGDWLRGCQEDNVPYRLVTDKATNQYVVIVDPRDNNGVEGLTYYINFAQKIAVTYGVENQIRDTYGLTVEQGVEGYDSSDFDTSSGSNTSFS